MTRAGPITIVYSAITNGPPEHLFYGFYHIAVVVLCYFQLLTIFVTGKIKQYMEFYTANKDFVSSLGNWFLT